MHVKQWQAVADGITDEMRLAVKQRRCPKNSNDKNDDEKNNARGSKLSAHIVI